jgi:hypothetical protein
MPSAMNQLAWQAGAIPLSPLVISGLRLRAIRSLIRHAATKAQTFPHLGLLSPGGFSSGDTVKVAVYYEPNRISISEVYPFIHYAEAFRRRYNAEIKLRNVARAIADPSTILKGADIIIAQTWFRIGETELRRLLEALRASAPGGVIAFLDSFAPSDIRLASAVNDYVDFYLKKTFLKDRTRYRRETYGDTVLSDFYGPLYGIDLKPTLWRAPAEFFSKLRLFPNFFTAPALIHEFERPMRAPLKGRTIDLHARIAEGASAGPYTAMRKDATAKISALKELRCVTGATVDRDTFMAEMRNSKLCFSPFGYGEICWRDFEAIAAGAVFVKPSMDHLESAPDLYVAGETYAPIKWDMTDLGDVVARLLADDPERERIATTAFNKISDYVCEERFVDDMGFLFAGRGQNGASHTRSP